MTTACLVDRPAEPAQAVYVAVVANSEERPAWHVANAGGFDDDGPGTALGESGVPLDDVFGDFAVFVRTPGTIAGTQVR